MIRFKIDIMQALKDKGYNTTRIRKENIFSESTMTRLRKNEQITTATLNTLCELLKKQPGQIIEYIPDSETINK